VASLARPRPVLPATACLTSGSEGRRPALGRGPGRFAQGPRGLARGV